MGLHPNMEDIVSKAAVYYADRARLAEARAARAQIATVDNALRRLPEWARNPRLVREIQSNPRLVEATIRALSEMGSDASNGRGERAMAAKLAAELAHL